MRSYLCVTCGLQFPPAEQPPARCLVCDDARQYVPASGQAWTTLEKLAASHRNAFQQLEPDLFGIGTTPDFAIGQRALLIRRPEGNILWDCVALLDAATIEIVRALGGISAIGISHPHYYTTMVEWAAAFAAPIHLHASDRAFVARPDGRIKFWDDDRLDFGGGVTMLRTGGHFDGSAVLHWAAGAGGRGALFTGDTIQVVGDLKWVSFMYSYPNQVPLPAAKIAAIRDAVAPFAFERLYGAFWRSLVSADAKGAVERSAARYLQAITSGF